MDLSDWAMMTYVRTNDEQWVACLRVLSGTYILKLENQGGYSLGPTWYLSVQMQFYFVMGILSGLAKTQAQRRKVLFTTAGLICGVCFVGRFLFLIDMPFKNPLIRYIIWAKADFPFYGVLLYGIAEHLPEPKDSSKSMIAVKRLLSLLMLLFPLFVLAHCGNDLQTLGNSMLVGLGYPVCAICYGLLVLMCATGQKTFLPRESRLLAYLSSRSYLLYLYNLPGLMLSWLVIYRFFEWTFYTGNYLHYGIAQLLIGGIFCIALAEIDYQLIEKKLVSRSGIRALKEQGDGHGDKA